MNIVGNHFMTSVLISHLFLHSYKRVFLGVFAVIIIKVLITLENNRYYRMEWLSVNHLGDGYTVRALYLST